MASITLTDQQYKFLNSYHEAVIFGVILAKFLNDYHVILTLERLEEYSTTFGDMLWDDVIDRYEDHPDYDATLYKQLVSQLTKLGAYRP